MSAKKEEQYGAATPGRKGRSGKGKPDDVKWVNYQPNVEDRAWLADNTTGLLSLFFELVDDMEEGQRLTLKYDDYSSRWVAMYFAGGSAGQNRGLALSVRGATAYHAAVLLAYVHLIKFNREWAEISTEDESDWG